MRGPLQNKDYDLLLVAGFAENGEDHRVANLLNDRLAPRSVSTVAMAPLSHTGKTYEESIGETINSIRGETLLVGHCAGALVALAAACRLEFAKILKLILIYGPINSEVEVNAVFPLSLPFLHFYRERLDLLQGCEPILSRADKSRIVTIGNQKDRIVPPAATKLSGDYQEIQLSDERDLTSVQQRDRNKGTHIVLPYEGHMLRGDRLEFLGDVIEEVMNN